MPNYRYSEIITIKNSKFSDQGNEIEYVIINIDSI